MEYEKPFIYIDTNFDIDEAMMLMMAFRSYDFELVGLSTSPGLMSPKAAAENIVALSAYDELFLSISAGEELEKTYADTEIFTTTADYIEEMPAFENIIDKADDCGKLDIITTGSLTNVAAALNETPEIEDYISHIFILGGSLSGEVSENFALDPKAADMILNTGIDIFILPEEVYKHTVLTDELIDRLYGSDSKLDKILDIAKARPEDSRHLGAALLLYLTQAPEAFIFEENGYKVETNEDAGAIVRSSSRKQNYMANKVNEDSFYDYLLGGLTCN